MSEKHSNVVTIVIMFFLFGMISFVTGMQDPFGVIVRAQFHATNFMSQLGNFANFIAYACMGLPAGMLLKRFGYRITALTAVAIGFSDKNEEVIGKFVTKQLLNYQKNKDFRFGGFLFIYNFIS